MRKTILSIFLVMGASFLPLLFVIESYSESEFQDNGNSSSKENDNFYSKFN